MTLSWGSSTTAFSSSSNPINLPPDRSEAVPTSGTIKLREEAEKLLKVAQQAKARNWSQLAIRTAEQEAINANRTFQHSFQVDEALQVNKKRAVADHLSKAAKFALDSQWGPESIKAANKEAAAAYKTYEDAYHEAERRRWEFANPNPTNTNNTSTNLFGTTTSNQQQQNQQSINPSNANATKIDLEHLRPTTKFDVLTEPLQNDLLAADKAIQQHMNHCTELEVTLMPKVQQTGEQIPAEIELIERKLENVQDGFGGDAEECEFLEKWVVKKDAGEVRLVERNVQRVKAPGQYQLGPGSQVGADGVPSAVFNGGLSGWWNNPTAMRGSMRHGGRSIRDYKVPTEDDAAIEEEYVDPSVKPPANLVDLFDRRAEEMRRTLNHNKKVLGEIEEYVDGVEDKVRGRERELIERQEYGYAYGEQANGGIAGERARQKRQLNLAFEEAHRSLYDVAARVSELREGLIGVAGAG